MKHKIEKRCDRAVYPTVGPELYFVRCSCGWESERYGIAKHADERGEQHVAHFATCGNTDNTLGYACDCPKGHPGLEHWSREHNYRWHREGPIWASTNNPHAHALSEARELKR